jgi:uncharacterized membrane protein
MYKYLLYFLVFSFLGWCAEVVFYIFKTGRLVNRGIAKGPICPIYGIGICLSYLLLGSLDSFVLTAILSMAVATIVEFSVGLFTDKTLGRRLWDYSSERGNILGYVCPRFSILWGVISAAVVKLIPRLDPLIEMMQTPFGYGTVFVLCVLSLADIRSQMLKKKIV